MAATAHRIAQVTIEKLEVDSPPIKLPDLIEEMLVLNFEEEKGFARERAEAVLPKVKRLLEKIIKEGIETGDEQDFRFSDTDDRYIQGIAYISPADQKHPEIVRYKKRRAQYPKVLETIRSLTAEQFEILGSRVLELLGCHKSRVTRRTGDQGIDFYGNIRLSDLLDTGSPFLKFESDLRVWLIGQAKHYPDRPIAPSVVREIIGAIKLAGHKAYSTKDDPYVDMNLRICEPVFYLLWTTGTFSRGAIELCKKSGVIAKTGLQLAKLLADKGIGVTKVNDKEEFSQEAFIGWLEI